MHVTRSHFPRLSSCRAAAALALGLLAGLACPARATGSWTPLSAQAPDAIGTTLLLTDGSVMAQGTSGAAGASGSGSSAHWFKLTPDARGSYANGTWTKLTDMHHERLYYASAVLRDGRVFVAGGEYTEAGYVDTNTAEIYDPVKNAWTEISGPAGWDNIGDAPTKMLADGTVLLGSISSYQTGLYNPAANTWAAGANTLGGCDEASWTLLPDQSILTVDINYSPNAEKYLPSSDTWVAAGQTAVSLVTGNEIGPAVLLPGGQCLYVGATGHTALYTPPSSPSMPGAWVAGPDFPTDGSGNQLEAKDAPGCLLVNGKVLCVVAPHGDSDGGYPFGQRFFEYTPDSRGLSGGSLAAAPDSGLDSANMPAFTGRLLALPNGQALYSNFNSELAVYTPDGGPNPAWKPAVSGVAAQADGSYRVSGTQFNGLSEGSGYGDDAAQSTNYPLVRLTSGAGAVSYARTFNHSTMAVATGALPVATSFTLPAGLAPGAYQLQVVANGISSDPVSFTVPSAAPASFVNGSFEAPNLGAGGYQYNPDGAGWAFSGNSGIQSNGSAWGAAPAPDGTQTAFLQGNPGQRSAAGVGVLGAIAQPVTFPAAGTYTLSFQGARRQGQIQPVQVSVDGVQVGSPLTPASSYFQAYTTAAFTVGPGTHTVMLSATATTGDTTTLIDQVAVNQVAAVAVLTNGSFEAPNLGAGGYQYNPDGAGWAFSGNSGIQSNGSAWGAAPAPDGTQTAFLQGNPGQRSAAGVGVLGAIAQPVTFPAAGTYTLSFQGARRQGQEQPLKFSVDGVQVGSLMAPISSAFALMKTASFTLTAGTHTLKLEAVADGADKSTFVDQLSLNRQ